LKSAGDQFFGRHRWTGWGQPGVWNFESREGEQQLKFEAGVLALGGASWPQLGSDAAWVPLLEERGVRIAPLKPANCGFDVAWSDFMLARYPGTPLKSVALRFTDRNGVSFHREGEMMISSSGIEGSLVYALSALVREEIRALGAARVYIDLLPAKSLEQVAKELQRPRGGRSTSEHLRRRLGLQGIKTALLYEFLSPEEVADIERLARAIKNLPVRLESSRPIAEAISTAGGVPFEELDENLMLQRMPGVFCAGEMLDWEAPTGGYLLTACFATGRAAGAGACRWLQETG
jgi:uncharacterized flavoprotein (TIGR03862 family)